MADKTLKCIREGLKTTNFRRLQLTVHDFFHEIQVQGKAWFTYNAVTSQSRLRQHPDGVTDARRQAPSSSQTSGKSHLFCLRHLADSCSHKNIRRRRAVDMHFVAVMIQLNFYYLTPTVLQSRRRICVASATYVHICRKASATISQTRRRHDCVI